MEKTLILHNNEYKKWNNSSGNIVSNNTIIPTMTSNTTPNGIASASSEQSTSYQAWMAFNAESEPYGWLTPVGTTNGWLSYQFLESRIISRYSVTCGQNTQAPKDWTFEGWNGSTWETLDSITNAINWIDGEERIYDIKNTKSYIRYRINVTSVNGGLYVGISELKMYELVSLASPSSWQTVSTTIPTINQFVDDGMDSLTPLLDRKVMKLESQNMTLDSNPLGNGKLYRKKVDLNKYFDLRTITTETRNS